VFAPERGSVGAIDISFDQREDAYSHEHFAVHDHAILGFLNTPGGGLRTRRTEAQRYAA
jgi:hypothetical protein